MKSKSGIHASARRRHSLGKKVQRKATTFRFSPDVQKRLELLHKLKKAPLNQLVNRAVDQYVTSALAEEEVSLTETLRRIREARQVDPNFEAAIAEFAESEAALASEDPVEGKVIKVQPARKVAREGGVRILASEDPIEGEVIKVAQEEEVPTQTVVDEILSVSLGRR